MQAAAAGRQLVHRRASAIVWAQCRRAECADALLARPWRWFAHGLLILLAHALLPWALAPAVEAPLLVAGTLSFSLLGWAGVRRVGWLRPVFGMHAPASVENRPHTPALPCPPHPSESFPSSRR